MRQTRMLFLVLFLGVAFTSLVKAQSTGFVGFNVLTINKVGSGGTSCIPVTIAQGKSLTLNVTSEPNAPVFLFLGINPCVIGSTRLNNCLSQSGRDEQTIDVPFISIMYIGMTDASGSLTQSISSCPSGLFFSVQAAIIKTNCPGPKPEVVVSQAFDVKCE